MKTIDWLPAIREIREDLGLSECVYPDAVILALIDVESGGDPFAHREGSKFWGLLQMGPPAAKDVGLEDVSDLDGDGEAAIEACLRLLDRYEDRHDGDPRRIAVLWKGGAGTARTVEERLVAGIDLRRAMIYASEKHRVPRLVEYVRRFQAALRNYGG